MSYKKIEAALETHLLAIPSIPDVSFENGGYTPTTGTPYIEAVFLPTIREPATRGNAFQTYYQGVFRLECNVPANKGRGEAITLVESIIDAFEANTDITFDGLTITTRYVEKETGTKEGAFYNVPINVGWYVYTNTQENPL